MVPDIVLYAIFFGVLILSLIWLFLAGIVVHKSRINQTETGKDGNREKIIKASLFIIFGCGPFIYIGVKSWHYNYELGQMREMEKGLVATAVNHLPQLCEKEGKLEIFEPLFLNQGIFVRTSLFTVLNKTDRTLPSTPPLTWRQKMQLDRYGESFPPSVGHQYNSSVKLTRYVRVERVAKIIGADFFVEDDYPHQNTNHRHRRGAKYELTFEDISTSEDRSKWVARIRLQLIERSSLKPVAEYVGFAANIAPMLHEPYWSKIRGCPNSSLFPEEYGNWGVGEFFISKLASMRQ